MKKQEGGFLGAMFPSSCFTSAIGNFFSSKRYKQNRSQKAERGYINKKF